MSLALNPLIAGVARLVPAGAVADAVLALDGDEVVAFRSGGQPTLAARRAVQPRYRTTRRPGGRGR